ncbi:hypothetical protein [Streptomyces sp. NPDC002640]
MSDLHAVDDRSERVVHPPRQRCVVTLGVKATVGVVIELAEVLHELRPGQSDLDQAALALCPLQLARLDTVERIVVTPVPAALSGPVPHVFRAGDLDLGETGSLVEPFGVLGGEEVSSASQAVEASTRMLRRTATPVARQARRGMSCWGTDRFSWRVTPVQAGKWHDHPIR